MRKLIQIFIMKANDFRLGNYILSDNKIRQIEGIEGRIGTKISYKGIKLTPGRLEGMGFKEYNGFYCKGMQDGKNHEMCIEKKRGEFILPIGYDDLVIELKYIHQLQNLYFALTYEELKISELIKK